MEPVGVDVVEKGTTVLRDVHVSIAATFPVTKLNTQSHQNF